MPDESLISEIESMLSEIIRLGGENERTQIVPNLTIQDASPAGLTGFIIVSDNRDGDNILAKKVPGVIYNNNDLVNVMFLEGTEAIAFQQGSESPSSGLWSIVPSTSTDIYYNDGDVGIGKSVAPDARLEVLDASQAQLRLTHTEDTKYVNFTLDTNHDLTIKPSSTGQIILQPTTDSVDFFQVLDADGGTPVLNVDSTNERVGIQEAAPTASLHINGSAQLLKIEGTHSGTVCDIVPTANGSGGSQQIWRQVPVFSPSAALTTAFNFNTNVNVSNSAFDITNVYAVFAKTTINASYSGNITNIVGVESTVMTNNGTGTTVASWYGFRSRNEGGATNNYGYWSDMSAASNKWALYTSGTAKSYLGGDLGVGVTSPQGQIHAYDSISGFMIWEYDGLNTTVRTIIANGTGDVLYRLHAAYVLRDSAAAVASGTTDVSNGASVNLTVGGNTVRLRVNADGSTDIARTAGTDTIKVALTLRWL